MPADKSPSLPPSKGVALVTGASAGIGAVYADRLAKRGYDLILVARNKDRLTQLAERLRAETGRTIEVRAADLSDRSDLAGIEALLREDARITMLVNNAGVMALGTLIEADVARTDEMITLNVQALTRLAYAAGPGFVARGGGTIINIGSVLAVAPELFNGVYGGTKAYVLAFSQSLQHELAGKGVRVQVVMPGVTVSELLDRAGASLGIVPKEWVMSTEDMVDAALSGLDQGEFATLPALADSTLWENFEAARRAMSGKLSNKEPARRYRVGAAQ